MAFIHATLSNRRLAAPEPERQDEQGGAAGENSSVRAAVRRKLTSRPPSPARAESVGHDDHGHNRANENSNQRKPFAQFMQHRSPLVARVVTETQEDG